MGCHTWFYKPTIKTEEELLELAAQYLNDTINKFSDEKAMQRANKAYGWTREDNLEVVAANKLLLERLQRNELEGDEYFGLLVDADIIDTYEDGICYDGVSDFHDLFRTHYTEEVLESKDDFLEFAFRNGDKISYHKSKEETLERVKTFFNLYPLGIITFG